MLLPDSLSCRQFYQACKTGIMDRALSIYFLLGWLGGDLLNLIGSFLADQLPLQVLTDSLGLDQLSNTLQLQGGGMGRVLLNPALGTMDPNGSGMLPSFSPLRRMLPSFSVPWGCSLLPRDAMPCPGMLAHPSHKLKAFWEVGPTHPSPCRFTQRFTMCWQTW